MPAFCIMASANNKLPAKRLQCRYTKLADTPTTKRLDVFCQQLWPSRIRWLRLDHQWHLEFIGHPFTRNGRQWQYLCWWVGRIRLLYAQCVGNFDLHTTVWSRTRSVQKF